MRNTDICVSLQENRNNFSAVIYRVCVYACASVCKMVLSSNTKL